MREYYEFYTAFRSLKDELCEFLKQSGYTFELKGGAAEWHFRIMLNEEEADRVNNWLDENTITEKTP